MEAVLKIFEYFITLCTTTQIIFKIISDKTRKMRNTRPKYIPENKHVQYTRYQV